MEIAAEPVPLPLHPPEVDIATAPPGANADAEKVAPNAWLVPVAGTMPVIDWLLFVAAVVPMTSVAGL
jgi:hypothetical protein